MAAKWLIYLCASRKRAVCVQVQLELANRIATARPIRAIAPGPEVNALDAPFM